MFRTIKNKKTVNAKPTLGTLDFKKMGWAGNDFIIFDARKTEISFSKSQIKKISNRKNIGCDQLIIIKKSSELSKVGLSWTSNLLMISIMNSSFL
jgi:hypothetical protein